jgi:hypothetical protein
MIFDQLVFCDASMPVEWLFQLPIVFQQLA